jgi:hypothetical protein
MSTLSDPDGIGRRLYEARFMPLPDVDEAGKLIGTRMWWLGDGYVECLALNKNGLALAVRAVAEFDYHQPTNHGEVIDHRFGAAGNALDWLLHTRAEMYEQPPAGPVRPYTDPRSQNAPREFDDREGQQ